MPAIALSDDQELLLRSCASAASAVRFRTSPETGTVLVHPSLPEPVTVAVVDVWDLDEDGLLDVEYAETPHGGTLRLTDRGVQALAGLAGEPRRA